MKVTIELTDDIIYAIAQKKGTENGYDWSCMDDFNDVNAAYASAFEDGMRYVIDIVNQQTKEDKL